MSAVRVSVEGKRGCGFRKGGGIYLVCPPVGEPCSALPVALDVCPVCHAGIKPTRGWTWIDPKLLLSLPRGPHAPAEHYERCPLAQLDGMGLGERAGLLWVGEAFYKTPRDFTAEAQSMGVSRRIPAVPKGFEIGTWVLLAHRKAIGPTTCPECQGSFSEGCQRCDGEANVWTPGVFHLFRPARVEYVLKGDETDEEIEALRKRGLDPVKVVRAGDPTDEQTDLLDDAKELGDDARG